MNPAFYCSDNIAAEKQESVILLHGLLRSYRSMNKLEKALQQAGYHTINCDYQSSRYSIEALSEAAIPATLSRCPPDITVHFVTHSLGGILLRHYLRNHQIDNLGRVVMLAPPNKGSELADWLKPYWLYRRIFGPTGMQLGTEPSSFVNQLGDANFELGVIAGTRAINLLFAPVLPQPNDGTVTVASTKLEGMTDHISLPASHPFIMRNKQVIRQVLNFLKDGRFNQVQQRPVPDQQ
ncbi:esterase/lipase family protein [Methylophaga sp. OBS4]|uniref:esterase/lipase family protein n=1 Tax=Methylophaga sp. OBS4 TaxID=2991935 RepID=UPI0022565EE1|nr:alpha/beta hydrolase [Methylophaga sp. OBS4]MCX4188154.1 alpha/beta hydrolase [Methylophaga sp. OBS4]